MRNIQSIKALSALLYPANVATFEQFLSANGSKLKYLWIKDCEDKVINRAVTSLFLNCPNLICVKIKSGMKLKNIELETIKLLPQLEKINLDVFGFTGSIHDIDKVNELLLRCKNSMRKVSLSDESIGMRGLFNFDVFDPAMPKVNEIVRILRDHKRTGRNGTQKGKTSSWIDLDGYQMNGSSKDYVCGKMSFYY